MKIRGLGEVPARWTPRYLLAPAEATKHPTEPHLTTPRAEGHSCPLGTCGRLPEAKAALGPCRPPSGGAAPENGAGKAPQRSAARL